MQALQTRIRQLEADNVSLAAAADQAAALAEEYAEDAARYRSQNNSSQAALVTELTDATRRKDRRIQRLNNLLASEKEQNEKLKTRIAELEELKTVADEIEETLKASVRTLQERGGGFLDDRFLAAARNETSLKVLRVLEDFVVENAHGDLAAFRVLLTAESIQSMAKHVVDALGDMQEPPKQFVELADIVSETAQAAVAWCFESASHLAERGSLLVEQLSLLEERAASLYQDLIGEDASRWSEEFARMKEDLAIMAVDTVKAIIPTSFHRAAHAADFDFSEVYRQRTKDFRLGLARGDNQRTSDELEEVRSKLNAAKTVLEQRNRELEDLRVRTSVFEERLRSSLQTEQQVEQLTKEVSILRGELEEARATTSKGVKLVEVEHGENVEVEQKPEEDESLKTQPVEEPSSREHVQRIQETTRLRRLLVQSHLADLCSLTPPFNSALQNQLEQKLLVRKAASTALNNARTAASNARVVRLDRRTLKPESEGVTMSRKGLLQSLAVLQQSSYRDEGLRDVERFAERFDTRLCNSSEDLPSILNVLRKSLTS